MKIREILLYSHQGDLRRVVFKDGLNIITGSSSTGKSALSDIIEYCMGRSTFNIPEGPIRDNVSWYGVIYQFSGEQVLVAKPAPLPYASSCSTAMIRRGSVIQPPTFDELKCDAGDDSVLNTLSNLIGIPANHTLVPEGQSRASYSVNIKHTHFYLFQKQALIANKDQLFYRQNEPHIPLTIRDTLPILLGASADNEFEIETKLRLARRDLKIAQKQLTEALEFSGQSNARALGLLSEAQQVGIFSRTEMPTTTNEIISILTSLSNWKPTRIPDQNLQHISQLEDEIAEIRKERDSTVETLRVTRHFVKKENGFSVEANEQKSRLESIYALPKDPTTGEWQWPFVDPNIDTKTPIATALINELLSLDVELRAVQGDRPRLAEYIRELENKIAQLRADYSTKEEELAAAIATNSIIADMGNLNSAAAKTVGRISLFLETYKPDPDVETLKRRVEEANNIFLRLEKESGLNDRDERLASALNVISNRISNYISRLDAEFSQFPLRFDLTQLTLIVDRYERPVPMSKTGGGANHLAYHLGVMLSLHYFFTTNERPIPSILLLDQPTQVYFPSEQVYKSTSGSFEKTERDSDDIGKVRNMFKMLYEFATTECPGFQIIITEHANLRDTWFQESLVEEPWIKPLALVPVDWKPMPN